MDELRECPWCGKSDVRYFEPYNPLRIGRVVCWRCSRQIVAENAVAAWNALPRKAGWMTYDGTEETLPATYGPFPVERQNSRGKIEHFVWCFTAGNWINSRGAVPPKLGDRWTPWPGEE